MRGFTLLELVVVIIIIGILATFGISQYIPARERALGKEAIANLKLIAAAERIYRMETGRYCTDMSTP
ncbi:MAG: prepilin-type N-terminal cleavage/methylation domain-containing protein, partial [Candidatus Omnitrophica bacterium]|nr:prepilin-type N-terminal cleavage/methylation domain-containing protein [Candidatus Omnitrophota bacterium]